MKNLTTTLTAWNEVQSLASNLVAAINDEDETNIEDVREEWPHVTLPPTDEIRSVVTATNYAVDALPENEQKQQRQRAVSKWLIDKELEVDPSQLEDTESYVFEDWNRAQKLASGLFREVIENGNGYEGVVEVWPSENPPKESLIMPAILDASERESNIDRMNELTEWLQAYHNSELESEYPEMPGELEATEEEWENAVDVADDLLTYFQDHERTFQDVLNSWPDFDLPSRTELTVKIPNIKGETRRERLQKTAKYLLTWHEEPAPEAVRAYGRQ